MKCDKLKPLMCAHEPNVRPMYDKSEVDAAIDELKTEHHKERDEYISMVNSREQTIKELKARIADLEKLNHDLCERVTENDEIRLHWEEIEQTRAENERLNNDLEKERSETIKYMDELCNAKNEIERITIDQRNTELRADVADAAIAKLKDKCQMHDFFWEGCGFAKRGFKNSIAVSEAFDRLETEKEERRWRKFPDEKPKWGEEVLVVDGASKQYIVRFSHDMKWISWGNMNTCESNRVKYWMPLPKAPKEADK